MATMVTPSPLPPRLPCCGRSCSASTGPGGGVTASDEVNTERVRFKQEHGLPVVVALGDLAASGGYYVTCAADQVVAHPTTVTGRSA